MLTDKEGNRTEVRICIHKLTGLERSAKIYYKRKMTTALHEKRFQFEIDILRSLDHPNIIRLFEVFKDKDKYTLV
jgi:serine/threonine protein kinase